MQLCVLWSKHLFLDNKQWYYVHICQFEKSIARPCNQIFDCLLYSKLFIFILLNSMARSLSKIKLKLIVWNPKKFGLMAQTAFRLHMSNPSNLLFFLSFSPKLSNLTAYRIYDGISPTGEQGEKYLWISARIFCGIWTKKSYLLLHVQIP